MGCSEGFRSSVATLISSIRNCNLQRWNSIHHRNSFILQRVVGLSLWHCNCDRLPAATHFEAYDTPLGQWAKVQVFSSNYGVGSFRFVSCMPLLRPRSCQRIFENRGVLNHELVDRVDSDNPSSRHPGSSTSYAGPWPTLKACRILHRDRHGVPLCS